MTSGSQPQIEDVEGYVEHFGRRYRHEPAFRKLVHQYLELSAWSRLGLSLGGMLGPRWNRRKKQALIRRCALQVHQASASAQQLAEQQRELASAEKALRARQHQEHLASAAVDEVARQHAEQESAAQQAFVEREAQAERALEQANEAVAQQTDIVKQVRQTLEEQLECSPYLVLGNNGDLCFDEEALERRLEEIFLQEIVEEQTDAGFMASLGDAYDGVIAHWSEIDDLSELAEIDWVQSIIHARSRGYQTPTYPYLISGKFEGPLPTSIDAAISVDTSQSMEENNRMDAARRIALATRALMRKLNPANRTFLSHFSSRLHEVSSGEFVRRVEPWGGTDTHLALRWLVESLADSGPAIAFLITDGEPTWPDQAIEAASAFVDHPEIRLRIFLVDGIPLAHRMTRRIADVAGPRARAMSVTCQQLPGAMITDVALVVEEMLDDAL